MSACPEIDIDPAVRVTVSGDMVAVKIEPQAFGVTVQTTDGPQVSLTSASVDVQVEPPPQYTVNLSAQQGVAGAQGPTGPQGAQGAQGNQGIQGPPGVGASTTFTYEQAIPSASWLITHNLGRYPSVTVVDSANDEVEGDLIYINSMQIRLIFSAPFSGSAYLN